MEWILARETVIGVAVAGAVATVAASVLQVRGAGGALRAKRLHALGYGLMALSMVLFVVAGFRAN